MDHPIFKTLRIAPTTQQGGTQTIQQSIYLTHNNPCGANLLIFQEMGETQIRYIDLKNYLDGILGSEEMRLLFEQVRAAATEYIQNPDNSQLYYKFVYSIMRWTERGMANLSVSQYYYPGYRFRVDSYDGSGVCFYDSYYPILKAIVYYPTINFYELGTIPLVRSQIRLDSPETGALYKLTSIPRNIPFINSYNIVGFSALLSNFLYNQAALTETVMAVASLLVDSANTRSFGIPKFGFSARENISPFGGLTYNCVNFIDIRTLPDENGNTTLVESIYFRLSLNEDTYNFSAPSPSPLLNLKIDADTQIEDLPPLNEFMQDEQVMARVVRMINDDEENLEVNRELLQDGHNDEVFRTYLEKLLLSESGSETVPGVV